jgi:hypothetical protein
MSISIPHHSYDFVIEKEARYANYGLWYQPLELKETHLGQVASTFSRTPSSQTITPDSSKDEKLSIASSTPSQNDNGIGMRQISRTSIEYL